MSAAALALEELATLTDNYNEEGSPAPSADAIERARRLLGLLEAAELVPDDVDPDAEGGVGFWFSGAHRPAWLVCKNSGSTFLVLTDYARHSGAELLRVLPGEEAAAVARLGAFLRAG